jgi:dUTP pyrophosphatase
VSAPVVTVRRLPHGRDLPLPAPASPGAAGADLMAALVEPLTLAPGGRALVPTGLVLAIPNGYEGQVRPRSGLALHHGITVLNAPGTIDADYRGEVGVVLVNQGSEPFTVHRGMRIAQLVVARVARPIWREGEPEEAEGTRGTRGFGSTGLALGTSSDTSSQRSTRSGSPDRQEPL